MTYFEHWYCFLADSGHTCTEIASVTRWAYSTHYITKYIPVIGRSFEEEDKISLSCGKLFRLFYPDQQLICNCSLYGFPRYVGVNSFSKVVVGKLEVLERKTPRTNPVDWLW